MLYTTSWNANSITLMWDSPLDAGITFEVYSDQVSNGTFSKLVYAGSENFCEIKQLVTGEQRFYRMRWNINGTISEWSNISAATPSSDPLTAVYFSNYGNGIDMAFVGSATATYHWSDGTTSSSGSRNGFGDGIHVHYVTFNTPSAVTEFGNASTTTYAIDGLNYLTGLNLIMVYDNIYCLRFGHTNLCSSLRNYHIAASGLNDAHMDMQYIDMVTIGQTPGDWYSPNASGTVASYTERMTLRAAGWNDIPTAPTPAAIQNILYNGNGSDSGTVPVDSTNYSYRDTVTVLNNTGNLTRTGFTFLGWNTQSNGTGLSYSANSSFQILQDTTLFALWEGDEVAPVTEISFTSSGSSFSPRIEVEGTPEILWTFSDGTTSGSITPTVSFGTSETRVHTLTVTPWSSLIGINLGYGAEDGGTDTIPTHPSQLVTQISGLEYAQNSLEYLCGSGTPITSINVSDFTSLHTIEFYRGSLTSINVSGCTSLRRLCLEECRIPTLNLTGISSIEDLRYADNQSVGLVLPSSAPNLWHICIRDNPNIELIPTFNYPSLRDLWIWSCGMSGELVVNSNTLTAPFVYDNQFVSMDFSGCTITSGYIWASSNPNLTTILLPNGASFHILEAQNCSLRQSTVDGVLSAAVATGISNGTVLLNGSNNAGPSSSTNVSILQSNGWTVSVNSVETIYTVTYNGNNFTSGSVPVDVTEYHDNDNVIVSGNTGNLLRSGYIFEGWSLTVDGSVVTNFTISSNTTLYAVWSVGFTILPNRTTGIAPVAVHFSTEHSGTKDIMEWFHGYSFTWNFGDPSSGVWDNTGISKNIAKGPISAHVYETVGTFNVYLTVRNETNNIIAQETVSVTVSDPNTAYSGTNTICVSTDTDFTGAPSGSLNITTTNLSSITQYATVSNRRILLKRGCSWTTTALTWDEDVDNVTIGAFGSGNKPLITFTGTGSFLILDRKKDWKIMDIEFSEPTANIDAGTFGGSMGMQNILFLRLKITGFGDTLAFSFWYDTSLTTIDSIAVIECEGTGANVNGCYVGGERLMFLGNTISNSGESHVTRVWQGYRGVISHNRLYGSSQNSELGRMALKLHGPGETEIGLQTGGYLEHRTDRVVINNNVFGSSGPWPVCIGPQNSASDERITNVIFEDNKYFEDLGTANTFQCYIGYRFYARNVTVRRNIVDANTSVSDFTGILVEYDGVAPTPQTINIYDNTIYKTGENQDTSWEGIRLVSSATDCNIYNNIICFPDATLNLHSVVDLNGTNTIGTNTFSPTINFIDPENVNPLLRNFTIGVAYSRIINHTNFDPSIFSDAEILNASNLKVVFEHASTGQDIVGDSNTDCSLGENYDNTEYCGLRELYNINSRYNCDRLSPRDYETLDAAWFATHNGLQSWRRNNPPPATKLSMFLGMETSVLSVIDVAMMKYCWIDAWPDANITDGAAYAASEISQRETFEAANPNVVMPYWTMPLQSDDGYAVRDAYNTYIRNYCTTNNKYLLDIADIENYTAAGDKVTNVNGCEAASSTYTQADGGHLASAGRMRLAQAYWTLITAIANDGATPPVDTTFNVTYNSNGATGGSVPTDSTEYHSGDLVSVLGNYNNLVRTGYIFKGWSLTSDGAIISSFNITGNTTLYAIWGAVQVFNFVNGTANIVVQIGQTFYFV